MKDVKSTDIILLKRTENGVAWLFDMVNDRSFRRVVQYIGSPKIPVVQYQKSWVFLMNVGRIEKRR